MNNLALSSVSAIILGLGATLTFDLWALFLKYAFKVTPSNFCLIGRWILYMPEGIFKHSNIASAPEKNAECTVGWIAHYTIGVIFASIFVAIVGDNWLQHPALIPAIIFGVVTVLMPLFIMQPAFGLGVAASKTAKPTQARLRSLMNHTVFGTGLYLFGWLASLVISR
ncbi:MAG: DUF2938 domain-containing protein [Anaerolineales bacterium]|nr:DUF2938 domain-containing protein [Anaerolineales bacterium]